MWVVWVGGRMDGTRTVSRKVRKNWEPLVLGPLLAMLSMPLLYMDGWTGGWGG